MTEREFLETAQRGDVFSIPGEDMNFWVKGKESVYVVVLAPEDSEKVDACECPGYQYRGVCYHLTQATRYWQRHRPRVRDFQDDEELRRLFA